jgi:hypothetical protein
MVRRLSKKRISVIVCSLVVVAAAVVGLLVHRSIQPSFDPFATVTPRAPCAAPSAYDMAALEKNDVPPTNINNPDYCRRPSCTGSHKGSIITRYDNMELLRTGTATLDIATDDGSPLDTISIWGIENVTVEPVNDMYSPDATARLTLKADKAYRKGEAVQEGISTRYIQRYPLTINIEAWCGRHSYKATITENLRLSDTP